MRRFVALLPLLITLTTARPQGYDYPQPAPNPFAGASPHIAGSSSSSSFADGFPPPDFPAPGRSLITKHIYVHVPPPDPDDHLRQQSVRRPVQAPRRDYKIIFIKAPTAAPAAPRHTQLLAPQPAEDKTIIYVLVKKPEEAADLGELAAATAPAPPSKPEVYFIRYKTKKGDGGIGGSGLGPIGIGGNGIEANTGIGFNGIGGSGLGGSGLGGSGLGGNGIGGSGLGFNGIGGSGIGGSGIGGSGIGGSGIGGSGLGGSGIGGNGIGSNGIGFNGIGGNGLGGNGIGGGLLGAGSKPDGSYGPPGGLY